MRWVFGGFCPVAAQKSSFGANPYITPNPITDKCQGHQAGYGKEPLRGDVWPVKATAGPLRSQVVALSDSLSCHLPITSHQSPVTCRRETLNSRAFGLNCPPCQLRTRSAEAAERENGPTLIQPVAKQQSKPSNQQPARSKSAKQQQQPAHGAR